MVLREIGCRSILTPSKIPDVAYAVNPYIGCEHGCIYCYAVFMKRLTDHQEPWGQFVDVKINGPHRLRKELQRAKSGQILLSSVTDPYQPAERRYGVTRACLEILHQVRLPVSILTKSTLVLRDLDLLTKMKGVEVGFTITTVDEDVRAVFEPGSSPVEDRFEAIRCLSGVGVPTWIFFGPVLPYFSDREDVFNEFFGKAGESGARYVYIDRMNLYPELWSRMRDIIRKSFPESLSYYRRVKEKHDDYSVFLRKRIRRVLGQHSLRCHILF